MSEHRTFIAGRFDARAADIFIDGQLTAGSPRPVPVVVLDIREHYDLLPLGTFTLSPAETRALVRELTSTIDALEIAAQAD